MKKLTRAVVIIMVFASMGIVQADSNWNVSYGNWHDASNWAELVVPTVTDAVYIANSGTSVVSVAGNTCNMLYVGGNTDTTGTLYMTGGTLTNATDVYIARGSGSYGELNQSGGTNIIKNMLNMAYSSRAVAVYKLSGGSFVVDSDCYIGRNYGDAEFYQSGDSTVQIKGDNFLIGWYNGATGYYQQTNGTLTAKSIRMGCNGVGNNGKLELFNTAKTEASSARIGESGYGEVNMYDSSELAASPIYIGSNASATGVVNLVSGSFSSNGRLYVGHKGNGTLNLGDASTTGELGKSGSSGGELYVRNEASATGTLNGWGNVNYKTKVVNNGRIIANGYGTDRTLDLSNFGEVDNQLANTDSNGWFAVDQGRLLLPAIAVAADAGTVAYNWGEGSADTAIDLVNSVRLALENAEAFSLSGALLAAGRPEVVEGLHEPCGAWQFSSGTFGSATLTFRYDDADADAKNITESDLKIWQLVGSRWVDVTASRNLTDHTLTTVPVTDLGVFAVSSRSLNPGSCIVIR